MGLILGIVMFMLLVLIHELGHFFAAKRNGVKVLEFGIGIPPKIITLGKDKSGTEYTLNLIPLGGFVRLKGEDPKDEKDFNAKDSFIRASFGGKFVILLAGVFANFVAAWAIFTFAFTVGIKPLSLVSENVVNSPIRSYLMTTKSFLYEQGFIKEDAKKQLEQIPVHLSEVFSGELGAKMGLLSGDIITSINNTPVNAWNIEQVLKHIIGGKITVTLERNTQELQKKGVCADDSCILGIAFTYDTKEEKMLAYLDTITIKYPFVQAMGVSFKEIYAQTDLTLHALGNLGKSLFSPNKEKRTGALNKLTGPVGAVKFGDMLLQTGGWIQFLAFAGLISLALAIFNVLPIPALDGGRLLSVIIQGITRSKPEKYFTYEGYINFAFFVLLMGLGIYIILNDLVRFWGVHIPFFG